MANPNKDYKTGTDCPTCHVDFWVKATRYEGDKRFPLWECPNCNHTRPRRVLKEGTEVTPAQLKTIEQIKCHMLDHGDHSDKYEIKSERLENMGPFVSYTLEVGHKNDEGTMASILCRDRLHVMIGRKGGMDSSKKDGTKVTGRDVLYTCITH